MEAVTLARRPNTPSTLHRRQLCPASAMMERGLHDQDSNDARMGRLFHRYWMNETLDRTFLTDDERDVLELSDRLLNDVLNRLAFEVVHEPIDRAAPNQKRHDDRHLQPHYHVEQTLATRDGTLSGTPDRVYVWPKRSAALVADLKSGFAVVERAELNMQVRGYAVLVAEALNVEHVYVAIIQPRLWSPSERTTLAHYQPADVLMARDQINAIIDASEREDAELVAGEEQCRYCRAKLTCPAFREALALPLAAFATERELSKAKRESLIEQRLKQCTDEQLERVIEGCKLAALVEEPARDEARARIGAGGFANFVLGKESEVRIITNVRKAIAMLSLGGVASREEILNICTIPLKKLEDTYRERTHVTWQIAKDKVNRVLASVIEREPRKPKILPKK